MSFFFIFLTLANTLIASTHDAWFSDPGQSSALTAAHLAYARSDFLAMLKSARSLLEEYNGDPVIARNISELIEAAYRYQKEHILPLDWHLPGAIAFMQINQRRIDRMGHSEFDIEVKGDLQRVGMLRQLRLIKSPRLVILDKERGVGSWVEYPVVGGNKAHNFYFNSPSRVEPYGDGLYRLELQLDDGQIISGWFILSQSDPGNSAVVLSPRPNEIFSSKNPVLKWTDYFSELYLAYEQRHANAQVIRLPPQFGRVEERWGFTWGIELAPPYKVMISAGTKTDPGGKRGKEELSGYGEGELIDGKYDLRVSFEEIRKQGDLRLGRESVRMVPFQVSTQ